MNTNKIKYGFRINMVLTLQVKLYNEATIRAIVLHDYNVTNHVRSFYVNYSNDGSTWTRVKDKEGLYEQVNVALQNSYHYIFCREGFIDQSI